jgi:signal peptidase I
MTWKWFISRTVRQANHAARHVQKLVHHQRDVLSAEAVTTVNAEIAELKRTTATGSSKEIHDGIVKLEKTANKWLKPYPHAAWRENVEVFLVAIAVAMGIRTFFLQPFKIPTGSMQPTLYGVTDENLRGRTDVAIPTGFAGFAEYWFRGVSYKHVVAKSAGQLVNATEPTRFILFNLSQKFQIGSDTYTVWFPPDGMLKRAGLVDEYGRRTDHVFQPGEDIIKLRIISGDHLFVDRVSYNFRRPHRGDIVVFETHGITRLSPDQQNTYYIKRLCGLGGETLSLKADYLITNVPTAPFPVPSGHLVVNGRELSASTPRFEYLYSFADFPRAKPTDREIPVTGYRDNHFHGHGLLESLSAGSSVTVRPNHYFVMGDNTFRSSDSRMWGDFPQDRVIGTSFFVYWPIGATTLNGEERQSRFGWSHR